MVGYRRFPIVKTGNISKTSVGTENEKNFQSGATSYNEIAKNMTQELPIYTEKFSVCASSCCWNLVSSIIQLHSP